MASAYAEIVSLAFYYPFDLVKTRMQTCNDHFRYNGIMDAMLKLYNENPKFNATSKTLKERMNDKVQRFKSFYRGGLYYTIGYTIFIAIEFSLFETIL